MKIAAPTVEVIEVENEGLVSLIGKTITLFCDVYIYTGKLIGVNDKYVKLQDPKIFYETGSFTSAEWEDAQSLPNEFYIITSMVDSFCILK